jgi:enamine deaminase RidA (YjgF/YER057c/UK114 family)
MRTITINGASVRAKIASDLLLVNGWGITSALGPVDLENDRTPLPEGVEAQTKKILSNLETILRAAGLSRDNVVAVRVYLVEAPRLLERMNAAYVGFFPADRLPVRSLVGATYLTRGAQVEMDFVLSSQGT